MTTEKQTHEAGDKQPGSGRAAPIALAALVLAAALAVAGFVIVSNARRISNPKPDVTLGDLDADTKWRLFRGSFTRRLARVGLRIRTVRARLAEAPAAIPEVESLLVAADSALARLGRASSALDTVLTPEGRAAARSGLRLPYDSLRGIVKQAGLLAGSQDWLDEDSLDVELKRLISD
jgi:hypothetical protein